MATNHDSAEKGGSRDRDPRRRGRPHPSGGDDTEQLIFTFDVATGDIVKTEKVSAAGKRGVATTEEIATIAGRGNLHEIETTLDEAFEAGISSVLDPAEDYEESVEKGEETALRRALLTDIVGRRVRRRLQRRLIQRLILSQTMKH